MLADADVVFISGGDVERGMQLIAERDLGGYFHELARGGKIFEAVSAGSIMLGEHWVRFPDGDDHKAEVFDCMGIVPHVLRRARRSVRLGGASRPREEARRVARQDRSTG